MRPYRPLSLSAPKADANFITYKSEQSVLQSSARVGRPKSLACSTCKERKIKCDLSSPACSQCRKSNWTCPGYPSPQIGFCDESQAVRQRYASSISRPYKPSDVARHPTFSNQQAASLSTMVLTSPATHLASFLIAHLSPKIYGSFDLESLSGHYLVHVPSRIGHNAGLDSAVKCICTTHSMFLRNVLEDRHLMRKLYLVAIGHLQEALRRPFAEVTPEILCASMLLRLFESLSSALPGAQSAPQEGWLFHTRWVRKVLQQRAAAANLTQLEKEMLRSSRGSIMVEALHAVEPCILDSSPWNDILTECYPGSNLNFLNDHHALWPRLVRLPRLICDVIEYNQFAGTDVAKNRMLQQRSHELQRGLDFSSLERSTLESLQLECYDPNVEIMSRTYGVVATTSYLSILTATNLLIDRLIRFLDTKYYMITSQLHWPYGQSSTRESALRKLLHASYAWFKGPSPASVHSKHAYMMWETSFRAVDALDSRGVWEEITSGSGIVESQNFDDLSIFVQECSQLQDHPGDSITSRPWMRILLAGLFRGNKHP